MTPEERVWNALNRPRTSKEVWNEVNKTPKKNRMRPEPPNPRISWERVEEALTYWLNTGMVRVTNKRFWRCPHVSLKQVSSRT